MSQKVKVKELKARKHLRKACHHATGMSTREMIADQGEYIRRFVAAGMALIAVRSQQPRLDGMGAKQDDEG